MELKLEAHDRSGGTLRTRVGTQRDLRREEVRTAASDKFEGIVLPGVPVRSKSHGGSSTATGLREAACHGPIYAHLIEAFHERTLPRHPDHGRTATAGVARTWRHGRGSHDQASADSSGCECRVHRRSDRAKRRCGYRDGVPDQAAVRHRRTGTSPPRVSTSWCTTQARTRRGVLADRRGMFKTTCRTGTMDVGPACGRDGTADVPQDLVRRHGGPAARRDAAQAMASHGKRRCGASRR